MKLGCEEPDKCSRVSIIYHVLMLTLKRRMMYDKEFNLEIVKLRDNGKCVIVIDYNLLRA